ncbi:restriction endonuclease, partial [Porphyromonas levii]
GLADYMIDYNLGRTTQQIYEVKKIDNDYFVDN